jgi:hypothetical protein
MLQEVQARWPMIAIWDDHEFSDDSWGATATYFDGAVDETDVERKRDAERAFFEWMPMAAGLGSDDTLDFDAFGRLFPIFKHTATAVLATGLAQAAPASASKMPTRWRGPSCLEMSAPDSSTGCTRRPVTRRRCPRLGPSTCHAD